MSRDDRIALVDRGADAPFPLTTQTALLGLNRTSLYYQPVSPAPTEVALKRRLDEIYTAWPFYGVRRITAQLQREGQSVYHKAVARHMPEMGIAGLTPSPNLSKRAQQDAVYPYLLKHVTANAPNHVWGIEIVCTQMTKTDLFATGLSREDVADLDFIVGHDHAVDQQLDQLPTLRKSGAGESYLDPLTKVVKMAHDPGQFLAPFGLSRQLRFLVGQCGLFLIEFPSAALILGKRDHLMQIRVSEPVTLTLHALPPNAQQITSRQQLLREPLPRMGAFKRGGELRVQQHFAEVVPDERIELACGDKP